jgi:hypothetical protein
MVEGGFGPAIVNPDKGLAVFYAALSLLGRFKE